jgi:predicted kinase
MPRALFLVGVPASGKSTFRQIMSDKITANNGMHQYAFVSSDDMIEILGGILNMTYNEVFQEPELVSQAMEAADTSFFLAVDEQAFIVIDRTNMSVKSRSKYLAQLKAAGYECDAVVFKLPSTDAEHNEWNKRLDRPGKTIPNYVLADMFQNYQVPTTEEGFANVVFVDTFA